MATQRILQNSRLLWVDANINTDDPDTQTTLEQFRAVIHQVDHFKRLDDCLELLKKIQNEKVLIITSESHDLQLLEQIQHLPQVDAIYVPCDNANQYQHGTSEWSKFRGYNGIKPNCEELQAVIEETTENLTPISFINQVVDDQKYSTVDLNRLESSFMYTALFKSIILEMEHEPDEKKALVKFCRAQMVHNPLQLKIVEEFDQTYQSDKAIWWYTRGSFIYTMLNRALRLLESDIIIDMGFFIHDLHRQLAHLHREQYSNYVGEPLTLYRGQGLSNDDFIKIQNSRGGLLAFNSFLSTSTTEKVSHRFASKTSVSNGMVSVVFVMTVDPTIHSATFANIDKYSYFKKEQEILFSMHSVFRVDDVLELDKEKCLFKIHLSLTGDNDPELSRLTDQFEKDTIGESGWERLGTMLIKVGQLNKAEELYLASSKQKVSEPPSQTRYYHQLGLIKKRQGDYQQAIAYHKQAISILEQLSPSINPSLATCYSSIGSVFSSMGDHSEALTYHKKALSIQEKILPANHQSLAMSYSSIGGLYKNMGEYSQALNYFEKSLVTRKETLLANHPDLAISCNNIGSVYDKMGNNCQALSYYEKARAIQEKTLPANHSDLATSYNNIGMVYHKNGEYSQALFYYKKTLAIETKTLAANHLSFAVSYNNIGSVYKDMGKYSKALSYYEKTIAIQEKTLPSNHPDLAMSYNNIGSVYDDMGQYPEALSYHKKALAMREKTLSPNHSDLAMSYNNIGSVYDGMEEYHEALLYYNKALTIQEKNLPPNHPSLAASHNNIGLIYHKKRYCPQALAVFEKAIGIQKTTLPADHPDLATSYNNIGSVYNDMGQYSEALSFHEKALAIREKALRANHPDLANSYNNIGVVYLDTQDYSKALSYFTKGLAIQKETLSANHPSLAASYSSIGTAHLNSKEYSEAKSYFEKVLKIWKNSFPSGHPKIIDCEKLLQSIHEKLRN